MEEILITEAEEPASYIGSEMSFEEAVKACNGITLEEFSKLLDEAIDRLIPE